MEKENKKLVLVLGLGASGDAVARFLSDRDYLIRVFDTREKPGRLTKAREDIASLEFFGGALPEVEKLLDGVAFVVISPGLSLEHSAVTPVVQAAREKGIEVIGEIEVFARELQKLKEEKGYDPIVIGITGTNGKTTTTMLTGEIAKEAGLRVCVAGNVGPNAVSELDKWKKTGVLPEVWVLELSSFQLETTNSLRCHSAALLNVTEDHIDWHGSMQKYTEAKYRIFSPQTKRILNREDPLSMAASEGADSKLVHSFGADAPQKGNDWGLLSVGALSWLSARLSGSEDTLLIPDNALRIRGIHNKMNALAASALAFTAGIGLEHIRSALRNYRGEPHRVQSVLTSSGIEYVDDSKGTNVGATIAALSVFDPGKVIIILGGDGKGQDFSPLVPVVQKYAKAAVFIGTDGKKIHDMVEHPGLKTGFADSMQQAVRLCRGFASEGDTILLSPACASWDTFIDYADRARQFTEAAQEIAASEGQP